MANPLITILDSTHTSAVSSWAIGTVKSQVDSSILEVNVWNNKAGSAEVSDLQESTVTVVDTNGNDANNEVVTGTWVKVCVNDEVDSGSAAVYNAIGGTTTAALYYKGATGTDKTNQVIKGSANSGTSTDTTNYCNCKFKVNVPMNATAGSKTFKVRVQGYYV